MRPQPRYQPGDKIGGRYQVHQALMGGMGEVYLCLDMETIQPYALKTFQQRFLTNPKLREAFEKEVATWVALEIHPNIVQCFWMQNLDNQPFMCLEWIASHESYGTDLRSWLWRGPLDLRRALEFTIDICRGLIHANVKQPGLVHCDLKPENLLIMQGQLAKITDFGLAQIVQEAELEVTAGVESEMGGRQGLLGQGGIVGTPPYMAPEQWRGEVLDTRTDIYAIGCILYEMLTGCRLFQATTLDRLRRQHLEADIPSLASSQSLPDTLNTLLTGCLAKQREERFASAEALLAQLVNLYQQQFDEPPRVFSFLGGKDFTAIDYNNRGITYGALGQYDKALANFDRAIQMDPTNTIAYTNRGITYSHLGQYERALADINQAIDIDPSCTLAYNNRASVYGKLKRYDEALADDNKCIQLNPKDAQAYANRGLTYYHLGRYDEALADCARAIRLDPNLALAHINRGGTYNTLRQYDAALADLNRAIELDPISTQAYFNRGNTYDDLQQYEAALADYTKAIEINPKLVQAYANRGMIYHHLRQYGAALTDYARAIDIDHDFADAHYNRGKIYQDLQQYDAALADYTKAIEINPNLAEAYDNRGMIYKKLRQYDAALADYTRAIELDPNNARAYNNRGKYYLDLQRYDAALADFNRAIELDSSFAQAYVNRGAVYSELRQHNAALADYTRAIEIDPQYAEAYVDRGTIHRDLHQYDSALTDLSRAIELDPNLAQAYCNRGTVYSSLERPIAVVLADYTRAIELDPNYTTAYYNRGNTYLEMEQYNKALDDFNQAIQLEPNSSRGYFKRGTAYTLLQRYDEALSDFNKAIEVDPGNANAYMGAGTLFVQLGRLRQALPYLEQAATIGHPLGKHMFAEGKLTLVGLALQNSDTVDGFRQKVMELPFKVDTRLISEFQQILKKLQSVVPDLDEEYLMVLRQIAEEQDHLGSPVKNPFKPESCIEEQDISPPLDAELKRSSGKSDTVQSNVRLFVARGLYHTDKGEYDRAVDAFDAALFFNPNDSTLYLGRGIAYAESGKYNEALADFKQSVLLDPTDASICLIIGEVLYDAERYEDAIIFFEKAAELGEPKGAEQVRHILNMLALNAWASAATIEKMREVVAQFPHIAGAAYIQAQEQRFVANSNEFDRQFFSHRLSLLRQATLERGGDFLLEAVQVFRAFGQAYSSEKLQNLVSEFPFLLKPGYVTLTIGSMIEQVPADIRPEIEKRLVNLQLIVNEQRQKGQNQ